MTDRKRSAISGEFVTDEYAATHPDTTVSESRPARAEEQTHAIEALLDEVRRSGCAVEIAGVRIAPCDERGQTADTRALDAARAERDAAFAALREHRCDQQAEAAYNELADARAEAKRLAERIEAAKQIGLQTHLGRPWADVVNDMLRALDGKDL